MHEIRNPLEAYKEYPGPILLLAGPGTGKTFQIEERIKFLLNEKLAAPEEIAVITFTNEAARNMRERLIKTSGKDENSLTRDRHPRIISTMHSLGNKIIGSDPESIGLTDKYNILSHQMIRNLLLQDACTIAQEDRKNWKITEECRKKGDCQENGELEKCRICKEYKAILKKISMIDYDDQILLACKILDQNPKTLTEWQSRTKYLLVDEYQDINKAQCELIKLLCAGQQGGLFVVGDDDQSIYSFRGGSPKYITEFALDYGDTAKIGRLCKSWRCPEHILLGAKDVIAAYYPNSAEKPDFTFSDDIDTNEKIRFYDVPSDKKEAEIIANIIKNKREDNEKIIIIIPNKNYLSHLKNALTRYGLDYRYKLSFDDAGISRFKILSEWLNNPGRSDYLRYILHMIIHAHNNLLEQMRTVESNIGQKRIDAENLIASLWNNVDAQNTLHDALNNRSKKLDENPYLLAIKTAIESIKELFEKGGKQGKSLQKFLGYCGKYLATGKTPVKFLLEIIEWENELLSANKAEVFEPVGIYNIPSSKGLEADVVIVIGATNDIIPNNESDIEEQSRLFYVAMTRAQKELYLFSARTRSGSITFKQSSYQMEMSPFVSVVGSEHIERKAIYSSKKKVKRG